MINDISIDLSRNFTINPLINGLSDHDAQLLKTENIIAPMQEFTSCYVTNINSSTIYEFKLSMKIFFYRCTVHSVVYLIAHAHTHTHTHTHTHRVSQEECARLRESVPYVKVYRYNPEHLYPKLNGYGDNGQRKVRSSCGSTYCTCSADVLGTWGST